MTGCLVLALAVVLPAWDATAGAARQRRDRPSADQCPRAGTQSVVVTRVADGDTVFTRDGKEIDIAGVLAHGSGGERTNLAHTAAARRSLADALTREPVTIAVHGQPDRYGRFKAQMFAGGEWVQAKLLRAGVVRASPDLVSTVCMPALLAIEKRARGARAGHWGDGIFAVRTPDELRRTTGTFQIVEGRVQAVAVVRSRVYLNFGSDWRSDLTVTIAPEDKRNFRRPRVDWKAVQGRRVRVRGWVESYNGPLISVYAPGQIEFLDALPKPARKPRKPRKPRSARPAP
jgi:endonuclease YncB( thermonuclease family)